MTSFLFQLSFLCLWMFFYSSVFIIFNRPFWEHKFVGFNEFTALVCWCTVIHHYRPQEPTLFRRVRWDFTCVLHLRRLGNVQLISYPRGLQQKNVGSGNRMSGQVQALDHKSNSLPLGQLRLTNLNRI